MISTADTQQQTLPSLTKVWFNNNFDTVYTFILELVESEDVGVLTIEKFAVLLGIW